MDYTWLLEILIFIGLIETFYIISIRKHKIKNIKDLKDYKGFSLLFTLIFYLITMVINSFVTYVPFDGGLRNGVKGYWSQHVITILWIIGIIILGYFLIFGFINLNIKLGQWINKDLINKKKKK